MKEELKTKWIKALMSGKYKQGKNALKRNSQYCCLGVLCDIVEPLNERCKWEKWEEGPETYYWKNEDDTIYSSSIFIPDNLRESLGISSSEQSELANFNDMGVPFEEIAGWIDRNL